MDTINYKIRTPIGRWYFAGVIGAIALPVLWGLINLWTFFVYLELGCFNGEVGGCHDLNRYIRRHPFKVPVYLTFIFGTPLAGLLGYLSVKRRLAELTSPMSFGLIGLKSGSLAHLAAGIIHFLVMTLPAGAPLADAVLVMFFVILLQLFYWSFVTAPLSIFCGLLFYMIAVKRNGGAP